jgi:hypothetical protein
MFYALTEKRHVVVDATWVLQCATSGVRSFPRPGQIRALSAAVAAELGTVQDQWGDSWHDPTDIDSLCEVSVRVCVLLSFTLYITSYCKTFDKILRSVTREAAYEGCLYCTVLGTSRCREVYV